MMYEIRLAHSDDAERCAETEKECLNTPWNAEDIVKLICGNTDEMFHSVYAVAVENGIICGICGAYIGADECNIINLAVKKEYRKNGIGKSLLDFIHRTAVSRGATVSFLEVAEDNIDAISLYEKSGYIAVGKRPRYYKEISAINMSCRLREI